MPGHGHRTPVLVVVTDRPSRIDDSYCRECRRSYTNWCRDNQHQLGQVLMDSPGAMLKRAFYEANIDPDEVFYTSVTRCGWSKPTMPHMRKCRAYLLDELQGLSYERCRGILLLGERALQGFVNDGHVRLRNARLKALAQTPVKGVSLRASYHPGDAAELGNPAVHSELVDDLKTIWQYRPVPKPVVVLQHCPTAAELEEGVGGLRHDTTVGLDLEWTGDGSIRMVGLSNGMDNFVFTDTNFLPELFTILSGLPQPRRA